jgi:hypothetical protein
MFRRNILPSSSALKMEVSSHTLAPTYKSIRRHKPEDQHRRLEHVLQIVDRLSDNSAFWWKALRVTNVNIRDGNSKILIIFYGLCIMSLWGPGGWAVAGFACRETARQGIDRAEHCCRAQHPTPRPSSPTHYTLRAVWGTEVLRYWGTAYCT